jgi:hypothetical protein
MLHLNNAQGIPSFVYFRLLRGRKGRRIKKQYGNFWANRVIRHKKSLNAGEQEEEEWPSARSWQERRREPQRWVVCRRNVFPWICESKSRGNLDKGWINFLRSQPFIGTSLTEVALKMGCRGSDWSWFKCKRLCSISTALQYRGLNAPYQMDLGSQDSSQRTVNHYNYTGRSDNSHQPPRT